MSVCRRRVDVILCLHKYIAYPGKMDVKYSLLVYVLAVGGGAIFLTPAGAMSISPWPYLQVYPEVDENDARTPLYFALMLSFGGDYTTIGALPAVQIALDYINSEPSILPGYSLHYTLTDSLCSRPTALKSFFHQINSDPPKVGWVGSGCSVATEPTAELTQFYNITQLSCVSSSSELSNRMRFSYYFQLLADEAGMARGFLGLIKRFGWKKVGLITQNENLFTATMDTLKRYLAESNVEYLEKVFATSESIGGLLPNPFEPDIRIYVAAMYSYHAKALVCEAHKRGLVYPKYQLLVYGWYSDGWWRESDPERLDCTQDQLNTALHHAVAPIQAEFYSNLSLITETGLTGGVYEQLYWPKVNSPANQAIDLASIVLDTQDIFAYAQHCHEATLALAMALHRTSTDLGESSMLNAAAAGLADLPPGQSFTLDQFHYPNSVVAGRMFHHLTNSDFLGISGNPVRFDANGIREIDSLTVYHYFPPQNGGGGDPLVVEVGEVTDTRDPELGDILYYDTSFSESSVWPDGVPNDGIPIEEVVIVSVALTVVYVILATAGLVFAVGCLVFNLIYRKIVLIRMSSPNLNYIIGLGAVILYLNVIILVIPTTNEKVAILLCNFTPWLTAIGYSLCYGTIVVKMMRVWYIFNNPTVTTKHQFHDWMLALAVLVLVVIDIVIIGGYLAVEGIRDQLVVDKVSNRENPQDVIGPTAEVHAFFLYSCHTQGQAILFAVLYGYKALLQVTALVLAFRTRKVKVKGLDDSKYIAAAIYVTSIVLAVVIISTYTLRDYLNTFPALVGMGLLVGTTMILALVFVPRMVGFYQDPEGKDVFTMTGPQSIEAREDTSTTDTLRYRIRELEKQLERKENGVIENNTTAVHSTEPKNGFQKTATQDIPHITTNEGYQD